MEKKIYIVLTLEIFWDLTFSSNKEKIQIIRIRITESQLSKVI